MKKAQCVIKNHPKSVEHAFRIAKEEGKEFLIIDSFPKENTYPIAEVSSTSTSPQWQSSHNTVQCRLYLQRTKPQIKCFNFGDNHLAKDCTKTRKKLTEKHPLTQMKPPMFTQHSAEMLTSP